MPPTSSCVIHDRGIRTIFRMSRVELSGYDHMPENLSVTVIIIVPNLAVGR
jgi:hypothetical protein